MYWKVVPTLPCKTDVTVFAIEASTLDDERNANPAHKKGRLEVPETRNL